MSKRSVLFALTTATLLIIQILGMAPVAAVVGDGNQIDRLNKGTTTLELFVDDLGADMEIELPVNAKVKEAELTMRGILPPIISQYDVGASPLAITGADVDGDGDIDLGVVNSKSDSVSILLNGDVNTGNFRKTKALDFAVDSGPQDLVLVDLSGDGKVDLATANYDDESVTVRLTTASDMFGSTAKYSVGGSPLFLLAEDMDGDQALDLIVIRKEYPVISVLYNKGDGAFNPALDVMVHASPEGAVAGDFNADGKIDIAVASTDRPYSVIMVENKGSKTLVESGSYQVQWPPSDVIATDFRGDGYLDLAVSSAEGNITILENAGIGVGTPIVIPFDRQWAMYPVDLDHDGLDDLVSVTRVDSTIRTFMNRLISDPSQPFPLDQVFIIGSNPNDIFIEDLDGDGDMDVATPDLASDSVSVVMNNGRGRYTWYDMYDTTNSDKLIKKGDIDNDGDMDLISTNYNEQTVSVVWNEGRGEFTRVDLRDGYKVYAKEGGAGASEPFWISTGDYDGDGDIDVEYGEELTYAIIMMFNEGGGEWDEQSVALVNKTNLLPAPPFVTLPIDVDGDKDLDIVTNHVNYDYISTLINDGTGHFKTIINHSLEGVHPFDMVEHDYDGDGDKDLFTANFGKALDFENTLTIVRNNGDGTFTNIKNITVKQGPRSLEIADFNGDGLNDIVVGFAALKGLSDIVPGEIAILQANGKEGTYKDPVYYRAGILPGRVHATDLNEDGAQDVICLNMGTGSGGSISIFINKGDGTLKPQIEYPHLPFSDGEFHDFLGDGRDELALPVLSTHIAIYRALYYPSDVSISVGGHEATSFSGIFDTSQDVNITEALNLYLKEMRDAGEKGNISVPIKVQAQGAGIVRLSNVNIRFKLDKEEEDKDDNRGHLDFNDPGTWTLFIMLFVLIVISISIAAPRAPEEVEVEANLKRRAAARRKGKGKKGKKKGKKRKVTPRTEKKEPKVKVEVRKKKGGKKHRDELSMKKLKKAVHLREDLMKKK